MNIQSDDYDSPWKEILEEYFQDFLDFFFPEIACEIDWDRGHTFLDKELQQVVRDAELGRRLADKLVQVWRRDGDEAWVLVHIEVQGQEEAAFAKRMYVSIIVSLIAIIVLWQVLQCLQIRSLDGNHKVWI